MNIEETIPKKETAEKLGIPLQQIFDEIKNLSRLDLIDAPREFILKGKIDIKLLKEIRKLGVEFSISGEKDRMVFATGSINSVEPKPGHAGGWEARRELKRVVKRYVSATYSMHSHDSKTGVMPSLPDVETIQQAKNNVSLIFTERGIVSFSCKREEEFNVGAKLNAFLGLKYSSKYPDFFEESSENNKFRFENMGLELEDDELDEMNKIRNEIFEDFCKTFDIIVTEAVWENEESCQRIVDNYFEQSQ